MCHEQELVFEALASCRMKVCDVRKLYVCTDAALRISSWSRHNIGRVEFLGIHMLFTLLQLILVAQYLISTSLMVESTSV